MKKIVRLTESDLVRLVKKVINESQMSQDQIKSLASKRADSCFDSSKYPVLSGLMKTYGWGTATAAMAVLTVFATGATFGGGATMPGMTTFLLGTKTIEQFTKAMQSDSSLTKEVEAFYNCLMS
jgi:hypothetical protein